MKEADFSAVVRQGAALQQRFPGKQLVAVGGTAAALHCGHRYSLDVDCVTPRLAEEYEQFAARLEDWPGWQTNRMNLALVGDEHGWWLVQPSRGGGGGAMIERDVNKAVSGLVRQSPPWQPDLSTREKTEPDVSKKHDDSVS